MPKLALTTSGHEQNLTIGHVSSALLQRAYERPPFLKAVAAFPAAAKVVLASSAVIATVVSISDRLPPAAAASMAEAAALGFLAIFGFSQ